MTLHFSIVIEKWRLRQIQMACIFLIHGPCFLPCSPFEAKLNTVREDVIGLALCNALCTVVYQTDFPNTSSSLLLR